MKKDLKINLDLKETPKLLLSYVTKYRRYAVVIFIVSVVALYGFLILQINKGSQAEPAEDQVTQQLGTVKKLRVDESAVSKMKQLEDQNISVKSRFIDARNNPFKE